HDAFRSGTTFTVSLMGLARVLAGADLVARRRAARRAGGDAEHSDAAAGSAERAGANGSAERTEAPGSA
ncbi:hypothetical protein Q3H92_15760, partial [Curtobacterium flaccumfaciens]|nr:hypothetical protein [Curtobacterium flaccumfaciens]